MIRVLIADDHAIVREGLKQILADVDDIAVTGEVTTGSEALALLRTGQFDAALLDITMPDRSGIDVLVQLKAEACPTALLILSVHAESQYAIRAIKAGAAGYLPKETAPEQLIDAIRIVASGRRFITPYVAERLAARLVDGMSASPHERLSDREFQILCSLAAGRSPTAIAQELCISTKTVSTYRARVLTKMSLANNAQLVRYALENALVR